MKAIVQGALVASLCALAACGGSDQAERTAADDAPAAPLTLTPGSWAANDERASFADESGVLRASIQCDTETGELLVETPGEFAAGADPSMAVRIGTDIHVIEGVQVEQRAQGPFKIARMPMTGRIAEKMAGSPVEMTLQTQGEETILMRTGPALASFVQSCAEPQGAVGGQ